MSSAGWRGAVAVLMLLCAVACSRGGKVTPRVTEEEPTPIASVVRTGDEKLAAQLLTGFHQIESGGWRWTKGSYKVLLQSPPRADVEGAVLTVQFVLPEPLMTRIRETTVTAQVENHKLPTATYRTAGEQTYRQPVPKEAFLADRVTLSVSLDKFLPAGAIDARELGMIVTSVGLAPQ